MSDQDPFKIWEREFSTHDLTVAEGVIDYAKLLLPDIILAPQAQRKAKSEEATFLIEERYRDDFLNTKLAFVAGNALIIEKLLWDEFVVEADTVDGPVITQGRLDGFRFVHCVTDTSNNPEPIYGLQLGDTHILDMQRRPVATIDRPLLVPVHAITSVN